MDRASHPKLKTHEIKNTTIVSLLDIWRSRKQKVLFGDCTGLNHAAPNWSSPSLVLLHLYNHFGKYPTTKSFKLHIYQTYNIQIFDIFVHGKCRIRVKHIYCSNILLVCDWNIVSYILSRIRILFFVKIIGVRVQCEPFRHQHKPINH